MMNFCPYEIAPDNSGFKTIADMDNLAYEIFFVDGFEYDELKKTTLADAYANNLIYKGEDERLKKYYNDTGTHYMLHEARKTESQNGMQKMLNYLEEANQAVLNGKADLLMLDCIPLKNGTYIICYSDGSGEASRNIMEIVPCCPSCHQKLPLGWQYAEDFIGISLLGNQYGGKTTFLVSMLVEDLECFKYLGSEWSVSAAHSMHDTVFADMRELADALYIKGECPQKTITEYSIAPVFLRVSYKGHLMIVGIYDNSGEILEKMDDTIARIRLLPHMYGHIYMIEPKNMRLELPDKKSAEIGITEKVTDIQLLTIDEQGTLQMEHMGERVKGSTVLKEKTGNKKSADRRYKNIMSMYNKMKDAMDNKNMRDKLREQLVCFTIVKCDILEELAEFEDAAFEKTLFSRESLDIEELRDENKMKLRQDVLERDVFDKYVFSSAKQKATLKGDVKCVFWHCISALGCDTEKRGTNEYYLLGEYAPIRIEEPLLTCVIKRVEDNGWFED